MKRRISSLSLLCAVVIGVASPSLAGPRIIKYYHTDAVGNVRTVTDSTGAIIERHDYLPFGEECTTGSCVSDTAVGAGQTRKFTGKERDNETGLDYFGGRYLTARYARFTTVDPGLNIRDSLVNPQKWNRYAYSLNNPLRYVDPDGREEVTININSFIPGAVVTTPWPMKGDGRAAFEEGTSRTSQSIVVETDASKNPSGFVSESRGTGQSLGLGADGILTHGHASPEGIQARVSRTDSGDVQINATASVSYPNMPAAPIRYDLNITVRDQKGSVGVDVSGRHTRFPGFEVTAQREGSKTKQPVYSRTPGSSGLAPLGILATMPAQTSKTLEKK